MSSTPANRWLTSRALQLKTIIMITWFGSIYKKSSNSYTLPESLAMKRRILKKYIWLDEFGWSLMQYFAKIFWDDSAGYVWGGMEMFFNAIDVEECEVSSKGTRYHHHKFTLKTRSQMNIWCNLVHQGCQNSLEQEMFLQAPFTIFR